MTHRRISDEQALQLAQLCHMVDEGGRPRDEDQLEEFTEAIEDTVALYLQKIEGDLLTVRERRALLSEFRRTCDRARPLLGGIDWFENAARGIAHVVENFPDKGASPTQQSKIDEDWLSWSLVRLFNQCSPVPAKRPYHSEYRGGFVGPIVDFVEAVYGALLQDGTPPTRIAIGKRLLKVMDPKYEPPYQMPASHLPQKTKSR